MKAELTVVPAEPVVCWPWHVARAVFDQPLKGGQCEPCGRDVAVPANAGFKPPMCVYCAMDLGLVDLEDRPLIDMTPAPGVDFGVERG